MAHSHEFQFGDAVVFLDTEISVHQADVKRFPMTPRTVTLFVKSPGTLFKSGSLFTLKTLLEKVCKENVFGTSLGVVNDRKIILRDQSITSYQAGVDVAEDVVREFNELYAQVQAAQSELSKSD